MLHSLEQSAHSKSLRLLLAPAAHVNLAVHAVTLRGRDRFSEDVTEDMVTKFRLNNILYNGKSAFQRIQVSTDG